MPRASHAPGTFLGAVLISEDAKAASEFYADIFGWDMERAKDGGFAVRHKGQMIAGISPLERSADEVEESFWLVGITVEDMDASLKELDRCVNTLGARGILLYSNLNGQFTIAENRAER